MFYVFIFCCVKSLEKASIKSSVHLSLSLSLSQSQGHSVSVTHPCHPTDSSVKIDLESIFNSPCTAKYKPSTYEAQGSLLIHGSGQFEQCVGNVSEIFSFDSCPFSHCSFDNVFQPNVTGSFMVRTVPLGSWKHWLYFAVHSHCTCSYRACLLKQAFSAFFYIHAFLRRITGIAVSTPAQMEDAAQTVCKMSFAQVSVTCFICGLGFLGIICYNMSAHVWHITDAF